MVSKSTDCVTSLLSSSCHSFPTRLSLLWPCPFADEQSDTDTGQNQDCWLTFKTNSLLSGYGVYQPSSFHWLPELKKLDPMLAVFWKPVSFHPSAAWLLACSQLHRAATPPAPSPGFPLTACVPASSLGPSVLMCCWGRASPASPPGSQPIYVSWPQQGCLPHHWAL